MKKWKQECWRAWAHACVDHARAEIGDTLTPTQQRDLAYAAEEAEHSLVAVEPNWSAQAAAQWAAGAAGSEEYIWQGRELKRLKKEARERRLYLHKARAVALQEVAGVLRDAGETRALEIVQDLLKHTTYREGERT